MRVGGGRSGPGLMNWNGKWAVMVLKLTENKMVQEE